MILSKPSSEWKDRKEIIESSNLEKASNNFRKELKSLINCHSRENMSDTPDYILAEYLMDCLNAFDKATNERTK